MLINSSSCKVLLGMAQALIMLMLPVMAQAQSVKDEEEGAFILCTRGTDPVVRFEDCPDGDCMNRVLQVEQRESQACVEWIAASVKRMTYSERIHDVEILYSESEMLEYRIQAEKLLRDDVEPIIAVRLNFDILAKLTKPSERAARLERIVYWAGKLAANQRQTVIRDIVLLDDFPAFARTPKGKKFIEQCRDEIPGLLPDISDDTTGFLRNLQLNAPSLMTPQASLVLLTQELRTQQFQSAQIHLSEVEAQISDWNKLPESLRNAVFSAISGQALGFMGFAEFDKTVCFPEFAQRGHSPHTALLDLIVADPQYRNRPILLSHIIAGKIECCDYEGAAQSLFSTFNTLPRDPDIAESLGKLLTFAEKTRSERLIASMMSAIATLSQPALSALRPHSVRLARLAMDACANALERKDIERAKAISSGLAVIVPETLKSDVFLMIGRVQYLLKNHALARQYWSQVIEENRAGQRAEQAYYLSVQTLITEGKKSEAEALKTQFRECMPSSRYLQMLP